MNSIFKNKSQIKYKDLYNLYHTLECHQNPASSKHISLDTEAMSVPACPQIKNQYVKEQTIFLI
jgi:hypothetical protein